MMYDIYLILCMLKCDLSIICDICMFNICLILIYVKNMWYILLCIIKINKLNVRMK